MRTPEDNKNAGYCIPIPSSIIYLNKDYAYIKFFKQFLTETQTYFTGYIRNLLFFNKILNKTQVDSIIQAGITPGYNWQTAYGDQIMQSITISSYIGALSLYNSNKVNIAKNKFTTNLN